MNQEPSDSVEPKFSCRGGQAFPGVSQPRYMLPSLPLHAATELWQPACLGFRSHDALRKTDISTYTRIRPSSWWLLFPGTCPLHNRDLYFQLLVEWLEECNDQTSVHFSRSSLFSLKSCYMWSVSVWYRLILNESRLFYCHYGLSSRLWGK